MKTLKEIESSHKALLVPMDICEYLQIDAHSFRMQVRDDKKHHTDSFGFPVMIIGNRIKIPKEPFIKYMRGNPPDAKEGTP